MVPVLDHDDSLPLGVGAGDLDRVLDGLGTPVTRITLPDGTYRFGNLPPGNYRVVEDQPAGYGSLGDTDGPNDNVIGNVTALTVTGGATATGNNFVDVEFGTISGSVTANGGPLAGITLALLDRFGNPVLDGSGHPITTVTGSDGSYIFTGIMPGSYRIRQTQPFGYDSFGDGDGGDPDLIGDVSPVTVLPGGNNAAIAAADRKSTRLNSSH